MSWRALRQAPRYLAGVACLELALAAAGVRSRGRLLAGSAGALLLFFRDPKRYLEPEADVAYAPADGTVVKVDEVRDPWVPGEEATRISTFLSLHNVHVTRSPVGGRIAGEQEMDGGYRPAFLARAEANRRRRLAIDGRSGRIVVVQVAGLVARKITSWVSVGDDLAPGERLGLIHFGSRTDVLLPAGSADVLVSPGNRVRAGQSPLARYRELAA
jgi:phosphatidylserine decarboxylase